MMRKVLEKIFTALIIVISIMKGIINKKKYPEENLPNNPKVLVTFGGVLGDGILFLDALNVLECIFVNEKRGKIEFAIKPVVYKLYKEIGILNEHTWCIVDFHKYCTSIKYFIQINKKFQDSKYDLIITPQKAISAAILNANLRSFRKITLDYNMRVSLPISKQIIYQVAYNRHVYISENYSYIKAVNKLVNVFTDNNYPCKIPQISRRKKILNIADEKYIVVAPSSSRKEKEWNLENYADTINYLIENKYKIYILGDMSIFNKVDSLLKKFDARNKIINLCGKTNIGEWLDYIYNAALCIGVDSATIHIAAASRVQSIVIVGRQDYNLVFPYMIDFLQDGQYVPVCIYSDEIDCQGCRRRREKYASKLENIDCWKAVKTGNNILCIKGIEGEKLLKKVKEYIN